MWGAHQVDGRISAKNAVKIRAALRQSIDARQVYEMYQATSPAVSDNNTQDRARARAWAIMNVRFINESLRTALMRLFAEAWVTGQAAADEAIYEEEALRKAGEIGFIDWSKWQPGDKATALLLEPTGAFKRILDRTGTTITGLDKTGYELVGTALADSIRAGYSPAKAAKLIQDAVGSPARALTIAVTESSRVMNSAAIDRYQEAGIDTMEWTAVQGGGTSVACDVCAENAGEKRKIGQPFSTGKTQPPQHPHCRCNLRPVVPDYDDMFDAQGNLLPLKPTNNGVSDIMPTSPAQSGLAFPTQKIDDMQEEAFRLSKEIRALGYEPYGPTKGYSPEALRLRERVDALDEQWQAARKEWYDAHFSVNGKGTGTNPYMVSDNPARDTYVVYDKATLSMNKSLRQGKPPTERVFKIDEMVAEGKAVSDTVVYRSAVLPEKLHVAFEEGFEYVDRGFQSTAVNRSGSAGAEFYAQARLDAGAKGDVVIMTIKIPANATARDVGVGEIVLPRDSKMRVTKRTKTANGVIEVEMEVLP